MKNCLDKIDTALYDELFPYIKEGNFENTDYAVYENMLTSKILEAKGGLLGEGINELDVRSQSSVSFDFDLDLYNPLFLPKFAPYAQNVYAGCFWAGLISLVLTLVYTILNMTGVIPAFGQKEIMDVGVMLLQILAFVGVISDPTTKGLGDSNQALDYEKPRDDNE